MSGEVIRMEGERQVLTEEGDVVEGQVEKLEIKAERMVLVKSSECKRCDARLEAGSEAYVSEIGDFCCKEHAEIGIEEELNAWEHYGR